MLDSKPVPPKIIADIKMILSNDVQKINLQTHYLRKFIAKNSTNVV